MSLAGCEPPPGEQRAAAFPDISRDAGYPPDDIIEETIILDLRNSKVRNFRDPR
jgi:hypothetical protein